MTRFVPLGLMFLPRCWAAAECVGFGFVSNPEVVPSSISGTVTIVYLGFSADSNGSVVNVTQVTLVNVGGANTMAFL